MEAMKKTTSITVQDVPVTIMNVDQRDYISLTDMAKARTDAGRAADVIKNWLRARSTLEFLGTWDMKELLKLYLYRKSMVLTKKQQFKKL